MELNITVGQLFPTLYPSSSYRRKKGGGHSADSQHPTLDEDEGVLWGLSL